MRARHDRLPRALLGAWLLFVAAVTLTPTSGPSRTLSTCLVCGEFGTSELLLNVLLFVPLGMLWPQTFRTSLASAPRRAPWRAFAAGAALSLAIETVQWLAIPGRTTSLGDVIANALGAALGAYAVMSWSTSIALGRRPSRWPRIARLGGVAAMLAYGHWSSTPWLPDGRWYLQRTPVRAWSDPHSGTLTFAGVDSVNLPADQIRDASLVHALQRDAAAVVLEETVGAPSARMAYVARVVEADGGHELLALARDGDDALLTRLTNAARARTGRVGLRARGAYDDRHGTPLRWSLRPLSGRVLTEPNVGELQFPSRSVLRGWTLLLPRVVWLEGWQVGGMDVVWALVFVGIGVRGIGVRKPTR